MRQDIRQCWYTPRVGGEAPGQGGSRVTGEAERKATAVPRGRYQAVQARVGPLRESEVVHLSNMWSSPESVVSLLSLPCLLSHL
jgi:hypothetical protein